MSQSKNISRRAMLGGALGAGALALAGRHIRFSVAANEFPEHRFVSCYFNGGWDVLLGPDARDPLVSHPGINLGTSLLAPQYQTPINVNIGGTEVLWGSSMSSMTRHADVTTLFRGVNMNTVAHPTGRAYVNSYIQPGGVTVRGNSLATLMASHGELLPERILPNVSIGVPSFNVDLPPEYTAVPLANGPAILGILDYGEAPLAPQVEELLREAQDASQSCVSDLYPGPRPADALRTSRARVRQLLGDNVAALFDLDADTPEMAAIRAKYGFASARGNAQSPGVAAAMTAQLIRTGLARSVTVQLQRQLDTHTGVWSTVQPALLRAGFDALANLLDDLRQDDPGLNRTTVLAYSEFARTPLLNGNSGRDHWFANSVLAFGGKLKTGVVGATRPDNLGLQTIDVSSGLALEGGTMLKPEHIGATIVGSTGGNTDSFRTSPLTDWIVGGGA